MRVDEMEVGRWYRWLAGHGQIIQRRPGESEMIEGKLCVPAYPVEQGLRATAGYVPADEQVRPYPYNFIRIA